MVFTDFCKSLNFIRIAYGKEPLVIKDCSAPGSVFDRLEVGSMRVYASTADGYVDIIVTGPGLIKDQSLFQVISYALED